jgi:[protein-PII] uridylyltransferase
MIEARLLPAMPVLFAGFSTIIKGSLDARAFFQTKRVEQEDRHQRFSDTPVQPRSKLQGRSRRAARSAAHPVDCPGGGLRQVLEGSRTTRLHHRRGGEAVLEACEAFLRLLRTHLHLHAGRREDRLLFEYQTALAEQLGFAATDAAAPANS